jgi:hypothetical protein
MFLDNCVCVYHCFNGLFVEQPNLINHIRQNANRLCNIRNYEIAAVFRLPKSLRIMQKASTFAA